jgi:hypothetical protein
MLPLSKRQERICDTLNEFVTQQESLCLFIEPPKRYFALNYCLLTFMARYEGTEFERLVYIVDTQAQAESAYDDFCKITEASNRSFRVKGGEQGRFKIQFEAHGITYLFLSTGSKQFRGLGSKTLCLFNLALFEDNELFQCIKSIYIVRGGLVSDPAWREQKKEAQFCIISA